MADDPRINQKIAGASRFSEKSWVREMLGPTWIEILLKNPSI